MDPATKLLLAIATLVYAFVAQVPAAKAQRRKPSYLSDEAGHARGFGINIGLNTVKAQCEKETAHQKPLFVCQSPPWIDARCPPLNSEEHRRNQA